MAAWGYIYEAFTGDSTGAAAVFELAANYSCTLVDFAWFDDSIDPANSHFMLGYRGSQGGDGDSDTWAMLYNSLWLRLFDFQLLPNQASYLAKTAVWYQANVMQPYGLPLNSRKLYTKDDWMTFTSALYYTDAPTPQPSTFSLALFDGFFRWANETVSRVPLSDWTNTNIVPPTAAGFQNRPVLGALYAPILVAQVMVYIACIHSFTPIVKVFSITCTLAS
jgi:hypothetical protein